MVLVFLGLPPTGVRSDEILRLDEDLDHESDAKNDLLDHYSAPQVEVEAGAHPEEIREEENGQEYDHDDDQDSNDLQDHRIGDELLGDPENETRQDDDENQGNQGDYHRYLPFGFEKEVR